MARDHPKQSGQAIAELLSAREPLDAPGNSIPSSYRELCATASNTLRDFRARSTGADSDGALADLSGELAEAWDVLQRASLEVVEPILTDLISLRAAKSFTEQVLTRALVPGPIWRQAYKKPLGYPGDFKLMNYIYDAAIDVPSKYGQLVHNLGVHIGSFVVRRMELMRGEIDRAVATARLGRGPIEITSVGSGPAREVATYLSEKPPARPVRFHLLDFEPEALDFAKESAEANGLDHVEIDPVRASARELVVRTDLLSRRNGAQRLIYSVGLFDYFGTDTAKRLASKLFDLLEPGGTLVIGNMRMGSHLVWPLEFIADWTLNYRTAEDMAALADSLRPSFMELRTDPGSQFFLLSLRR